MIVFCASARAVNWYHGMTRVEPPREGGERGAVRCVVSLGCLRDVERAKACGKAVGAERDQVDDWSSGARNRDAIRAAVAAEWEARAAGGARVSEVPAFAFSRGVLARLGRADYALGQYARVVLSRLRKTLAEERGDVHAPGKPARGPTAEESARSVLWGRDRDRMLALMERYAAH